MGHRPHSVAYPPALQDALMATLEALDAKTRFYIQTRYSINSYGHRIMNTTHPVRSALFKHDIVRLVLSWVTRRESRIL
jgi:hypothetical protein